METSDWTERLYSRKQLVNCSGERSVLLDYAVAATVMS